MMMLFRRGLFVFGTTGESLEERLLRVPNEWRETDPANERATPLATADRKRRRSSLLYKWTRAYFPYVNV
jgi:hypothetical protein